MWSFDGAKPFLSAWNPHGTRAQPLPLVWHSDVVLVECLREADTRKHPAAARA
jgi:hypothetical protein